MKPEIGLKEIHASAVVEILNDVLADEYVLYTKTRNCHLNVRGSHFHDLHKFFETQYAELNEVVDDVAERARALGGDALGTLAEFKQRTRLTEQPGRHPKAPEMIAELLRDHETVIRQLRLDLVTCAEKHGDAGTSDFLTGLMEQHEKMAWMLRVQLEE